VVEGPLLEPGGMATVELPLVRGEWTLETSYLSRLPITVTGPGIDVTMRPNMDRTGPRFPLTEITVLKEEKVPLTFTVSNPYFARAMPVAQVVKITATPESPERVIPIHQACGQYVDWYRSAGAGR
jgi:hypothetical protein